MCSVGLFGLAKSAILAVKVSPMAMSLGCDTVLCLRVSNVHEPKWFNAGSNDKEILTHSCGRENCN